MVLSQLLQARDRSIYIVAGITALAVLGWRRMPAKWVMARRLLLAWLIGAEWLLILMR